jgi:flagellar motor switch protein FliG
LFIVCLIFDDQLNNISYKSISSIIEIKQRKSQGLDPSKYCGVDNNDQTRLLNKIEAGNKALANNLKDNIEYLDQLRYMTTQMKVEFLKDVNHDLLAVALRLSSKELVYELFSELTKNMQEEFLDKLQNERPASAICKAQDEIVKLVRAKEKSGEIVLDPKAFVTYV